MPPGDTGAINAQPLSYRFEDYATNSDLTEYPREIGSGVMIALWYQELQNRAGLAELREKGGRVNFAWYQPGQRMQRFTMDAARNAEWENPDPDAQRPPLRDVVDTLYRNAALHADDPLDDYGDNGFYAARSDRYGPLYLRSFDGTEYVVKDVGCEASWVEFAGAGILLHHYLAIKAMREYKASQTRQAAIPPSIMM